MSLLLNVLRCPDDVVPQTRRIEDGQFAIGRGTESDWVLDDPDKYLSKRHCVVAYQSGGWWVADVSTNGTFVNGEAEPLGMRKVRALQDGDRLYLGPYEIEVRIEDGRSAPVREPEIARPSKIDSPFDEDPFAQPQHTETSSAEEPAPVASLDSGARLPDDFDPLRSDEDELPPSGRVRADHSPAVADAFRAPRPITQLLPEDWNEESELAAVPRPEPQAIPAPAPTTAPDKPVFEPPAEPPKTTARAEPGSEFAAFLRGAGMAQVSPADTVAVMDQLGRAFRAVVSGLRGALMARAAVKSEFRIAQTMIRARGNNPLKFSTNDDDAMAALLGLGRRVEMPPEAAVAEALHDLRLHELAAATATQAGARALLARLDPAPIRRDAERAGVSFVPAAAKARAWDIFESLHAKTTQALTDDFDSVFGRAFARAYEQAWREATGPEEDES